MHGFSRLDSPILFFMKTCLSRKKVEFTQLFTIVACKCCSWYLLCLWGIIKSITVQMRISLWYMDLYLSTNFSFTGLHSIIRGLVFSNKDTTAQFGSLYLSPYTQSVLRGQLNAYFLPLVVCQPQLAPVCTRITIVWHPHIANRWLQQTLQARNNGIPVCKWHVRRIYNAVLK